MLSLFPVKGSGLKEFDILPTVLCPILGGWTNLIGWKALGNSFHQDGKLLLFFPKYVIKNVLIECLSVNPSYAAFKRN